MSRLIEVNELKEWVENWVAMNKYYHPYSKSNNIPINEVYAILKQMPTIDTDAKPIRHGHWNILTPQDDDGGWVAISCSNCNFVTPYASSRKEIEENGFVYHYCMYCGALMDEVEE